MTKRLYVLELDVWPLHRVAAARPHLEHAVSAKLHPAVRAPFSIPATLTVGWDMGQRDDLFQRILCPLDFDDQCAMVLDLALRIAGLSHGRIWALHVVSVEAEEDHGWSTGATLQLQRVVRERLEGKADYEFVIRTGPAAIEILQAAKDFASDVVVIPTHGRGGLKRLVLGSIAEQVIRESPIPVITLRRP